MGMAAILAEMPDLRRRYLADHGPDRQGRCSVCAGSSPCLPLRIAQEAQRIAEQAQRSAETGPSPVSTQVPAGRGPDLAAAPPRTDTTVRTLKAIPAASWVPRW